MPGAPMRRALLAAFANASPRRRPTLPLRLLVVGGSQGARQLNEVLLAHYSEDAIFRIDHFLGKDPVQNVLIMRLAPQPGCRRTRPGRDGGIAQC